MARNPELERVAAIFEGSWRLTLANQWWVEDPDATVTGAARCSWLGDSFLRLEAALDGEPTWDFVFGRSDATAELVVLYQDPRPTNRVFRLTVEAGGWEMLRTDPDFHQRIVGRLEGDRMVGSADASEDAGATWRKDFDLVWERD